MGFGFTYSSGENTDIIPFIKYDARAGRMFRVDRIQGSDGSYSSTDVDITNACAFVLDLENVLVGWVHYSVQGPQRRMALFGKEEIPARPADKDQAGKPLFRQGFSVKVALAKESGGGIREFGSCAQCVLQAMDGLKDAYDAAPEAKQGALPVVKLSSAVPVKSGQSTNYAPVFEIVAWVARPEGLTPPNSQKVSAAPAPSISAPAAAAPAFDGTPAATGSTVLPPPNGQAAPAAPVTVDSFG